MENSLNSFKTQIKYKKTSCYFCNEWLDNESFKTHIEHCGQVLEKCPNNCVAYVQRKCIEKHLLECPQTKTGDARPDNEKESNEPNPSLNGDVEKRCFLLEQNVIALRSAFQEELRQRHRLITDVGELRKQQQLSESLIQKFSDILASRCTDIKKCNEDIDQFVYQYKEIKEWRRELRLILDHIHQDLEFRNDVTANIEILFADSQISVSKIRKLEREVELMKTHHPIINNSHSPQSDQYADSSHNRSSILSDQNYLTLADEKLATLSLEVKQMKNIVCETEDKCDKLENIVVDARKSGSKTKQELRDLNSHLKFQRKMTAIADSGGHLIWRIDQFASKLKDAKENGVLIKSPMFCDKPYGYTLRLDVSLNGIGTWKGRNILACLTVVGGQWDTLLVWPCKLQADIILRDQPRDLSEAKDISKTIIVKKRDVTYEQNQYIFISHKTLSKQNYLQNDTIFFEVKVRK